IAWLGKLQKGIGCHDPFSSRFRRSTFGLTVASFYLAPRPCAVTQRTGRCRSSPFFAAAVLLVLFGHFLADLFLEFLVLVAGCRALFILDGLEVVPNRPIVPSGVLVFLGVARPA